MFRKLLNSRRARYWLAAAAVVLAACAIFGRSGTVAYCNRFAEKDLADGRIESALTWLAWSDWADDANSKTQLLFARAYRRLGAHRRAEQHLDESLRLGLSSSRWQHERSLVRAQSGQMREVEPLFQSLLEDPEADAAEVCEAFVNGYFITARYEQALRLLEQWRVAYPNAAQPHYLTGVLWSHLAVWSDAESEFRTALELQPRHYAAARALADVLLERKQVDEALAFYRQVEPSQIEGTAARIGQARCLSRLGKFDEARAILQSLAGQATLDVNVEVAKQRGELELMTGNYAEALKWLELAREQAPRDVELRYSLASALSASGRQDAAKPHFDYVTQARAALGRAAELTAKVNESPDDVAARVEIGQLLLAYGPADQGLMWLRSALDFEPTYQPALDAIAASRQRSSPQVPPPLAPLTSRPALPQPPAIIPTSPERETVFRFEDVALAGSVDFTYRNGREAGLYTILESLGGGVAVVDVDRDGLLDLFFPGGGHFSEGTPVGQRAGLFLNRGDCKFVEVADRASVTADRHYTHGVAVGDYNNDGFADLVVTGYGGLQLFENRGDGTFQETTAMAGLTDRQWSTAAAWGDLNGDGCLDLMVVHYVDWSPQHNPRCSGPPPNDREICSPKDFEAVADVLYLGNSDGTFRDGSDRLGGAAAGKGLGVLLADLDADGDTDIYVANDTTPNQLYLNENGTLFECGIVRGVAYDSRGRATGSMGVDVTDLDADGLVDLGVSNYAEETFGLYRQSAGQFLEVSASQGLASIGANNVGWGLAFGDLDLDGDDDLVVANGHVLYAPKNSAYSQNPLLLSGGGQGFRASSVEGSYFSTAHNGRGLASGDLDNDGDLDLVISHVNDPVAVLQNSTSPASAPTIVRLIGTASNRDAIGARVIVHTAVGKRVRTIVGGGSYLSHHDRQILIAGGCDRLTILWPSGREQEVVAPNQQSITVIEPNQ